MKFVIAGRGTSACFHAAPGFVIAIEILFRAVGISEIADGKNRAGDFLQKLCGGFCTGKVGAIGDVASTDENGHVGIDRGNQRALAASVPKDKEAKTNSKHHNRDESPVRFLVNDN